jgi:hypothetical protein
MQNIITVKVDKQYGCFLFYPICEKAKIFAEMSKTKTLSYQAIKNIKRLGYQVTSTELSSELETI